MKYLEADFTITINGNYSDRLMQDARDLATALCGDAGFETFIDTNLGFKGYIQEQFFNKEALEQCLADFPMDNVHIIYNIHETENKNWNETWENEGFDPIVVDNRLTIHDGRHLPQVNTPLNIEIDAHMAFGTGTHETTRMVCTALMNINLIDKRLLDCGCGTGILGILALKCGALSATGYDIDEWSIDNAKHNAIINQVDEHFETFLGDVSVLTNNQNLKERGKFDIVVANIFREILISDMPAFVRVMAPDAYMVISGFYNTDAEKLIQKATELSLTLTGRMEDNKWTCLIFHKD